jgi:hypothetical protein
MKSKNSKKNSKSLAKLDAKDRSHLRDFGGVHPINDDE